MNSILSSILLGLSITAPLGPTNIEVIRRGLKESWKSSAVFCLGVITALIIYLLLVIFGLSFLTKSELFNQVLLFFGVIVLFYLSYGAIMDFFNKKELDLSGKVDSKRHFIPGIVLTISNPAVLLLWTGIMGADLASSNKSFTEVITLCSGILIGVVLFFILLIALINGGKKYITKKKFKFVSLAAGIILLYFGFYFGYKFIETLH